MKAIATITHDHICPKCKIEYAGYLDPCNLPHAAVCASCLERMFRHRDIKAWKTRNKKVIDAASDEILE